MVSDFHIPSQDVTNQTQRGIFLDIFFFVYDFQHCFICRPSDSTVSEDAGIEPTTVATTALAVTVRRSPLARNNLNILFFVYDI